MHNADRTNRTALSCAHGFDTSDICLLLQNSDHITNVYADYITIGNT